MGASGGDAHKPDPDLPNEVVLAEDGSLSHVGYKGYSFRGLPGELVRAAGRFSKDHETAFAGLRCRGFTPGVDCAPNHAAHLRTSKRNDVSSN